MKNINGPDALIRTARATSAPPGSRWLPVAFNDPAQSSFEMPSKDTARILEAAVAILAQGEGLLRALTVETYTRRVPVVFNACIGGHYRHCLDHFTSLMHGLDADAVDYDHRERDIRIESQPESALKLTQEIRSRLEQLSLTVLDTRVAARCEVSYRHGDSPVTNSTVGRELVYCVAHAIHHFALIAVMARLMDANLPETFGVAPSTVAHQTKPAK